MLLSICIPTRNRDFYVGEVVYGLLNQFSDAVEIIVFDNSDNANEDLRALSCKTSNLMYYHDGSELSFADNFEKSVAVATGEYVTVIGDDDFVFPEILEAVKYAKSKGLDSIISRLDYVYYWPGIDGRTDQSTGALRISGENYKTGHEVIYQKNELARFLECGMSEFENSDLARIYHGIVSKALVDRVIKMHGRIFGGLSPDIYSSIKLAVYAGETLKWKNQLTFPGVCKKSGSGQSAEGKHRGSLESAPHFRGHRKYQWEAEIPMYYSVDTIWAESAVKALKATDNKLLQCMDMNKFIAKSLINNIPILKEAVSGVVKSSKRISYNSIVWHLLVCAIFKITKKLSKKNYKIIAAPAKISDVIGQFNAE